MDERDDDDDLPLNGHVPRGGGAPPRASGGHAPNRLDRLDELTDAASTAASWPAGTVDRKAIERDLGPPPRGPFVDESTTNDFVCARLPLEDFLRSQRATFDEVMARFEAALRGHAALLAGVLRARRAHVIRLQRALNATPAHLVVAGEPRPWTLFAGTKAALLFLAALVLFVIGMSSVARVLQSAGVAGFENPLVAWLFTFIPVATAIVVEIKVSEIEDIARRRLVTRIVGTVGALLGLAWCWAFVRTFPPVAFNPDDLIRSITSDSSNAASDSWSVALMTCQLAAEVFLGATLWLQCERIVRRHRPTGKVDNRDYALVRKSVDAAFAELQVAQGLASRVAGALDAVEARRSRYLAASEALFIQLQQFAKYRSEHLARRTPSPAPAEDASPSSPDSEGGHHV